MILSLDDGLNPRFVTRIKKMSPGIRKGWLSDEVIGVYLFILHQQHSHILYVESTATNALLLSRSVELLWNALDLEVKIVFIPCNPSGIH